MLILKTLALEPMHGYGNWRPPRANQPGRLPRQRGSLFTALRRLERDGLISETWQVTENNRRGKYYALTAQGRATLKHETRD